MKQLIIALFTVVIINPYEGLDYEKVNAYYFDNDYQTEVTESDYQEPKEIELDDYLVFDDYTDIMQ